mmetsp:Transcript_21404/g.51944  ORF Transcript_21404/g.51944 Transcript_21404/m.51944 type:complete len:280 (-) Transcript_21404:38-877(-)
MHTTMAHCKTSPPPVSTVVPLRDLAGLQSAARGEMSARRQLGALILMTGILDIVMIAISIYLQSEGGSLTAVAVTNVLVEVAMLFAGFLTLARCKVMMTLFLVACLAAVVSDLWALLEAIAQESESGSGHGMAAGTKPHGPEYFCLGDLRLLLLGGLAVFHLIAGGFGLRLARSYWRSSLSPSAILRLTSAELRRGNEEVLVCDAGKQGAEASEVTGSTRSGVSCRGSCCVFDQPSFTSAECQEFTERYEQQLDRFGPWAVCLRDEPRGGQRDASLSFL